MKILWTDETNVQTETWVKVSQRCVVWRPVFGYGSVVNMTYSLIRYMSAKSDKVGQVRKILVRYYSLLYYTGIDHAILEEILPIAPTSANLTFSLVIDIFFNLLAGLPFALIRFAIFLPALLFHVPGYVLSQAAIRVLGTGEEAEYHSLGYVLGIVLGALWLVGKFRSWGIGFSLLGLVALGVMVYSAAYILVQWHSILIRGL